jgi:hypothetical protein
MADIILIQQEHQAGPVAAVLLTAIFPVRRQVQLHSQDKVIQEQVLMLASQEVQVQMDHGVVAEAAELAVLDRLAMLAVALMAVTVVPVYLLVSLDTLYIMVAVVVDLVKVDHMHFQRVLVVLAAAA